MADRKILDPHPPEFDRFLRASVGEDRNGHVVTVLSALARLGFDPWQETADLVRLGRDAARMRLGTLLARFPDVPALASDHGGVARDLSQLLPEGRKPGSLTQAASTAAHSRPGKSGVIWSMLAIIFVLAQLLTAGGSGSGE